MPWKSWAQLEGSLCLHPRERRAPMAPKTHPTLTQVPRTQVPMSHCGPWAGSEQLPRIPGLSPSAGRPPQPTFPAAGTGCFLARASTDCQLLQEPHGYATARPPAALTERVSVASKPQCQGSLRSGLATSRRVPVTRRSQPGLIQLSRAGAPGWLIEKEEGRSPGGYHIHKRPLPPGQGHPIPPTFPLQQ